MTATTPFVRAPEKAITLALRLAHARKNALRAFAAGEIDAVIDRRGKARVLQPAQEHLRQAESRFRAVVESAADVITVVNRAGVILSQNRAVTRVLGYPAGEMLGRTIFAYVHSDDLPLFHAALMNVAEGFLENTTARFRHLQADSTYRQVDAAVSFLREAGGPCVVFSLRPVVSQPLDSVLQAAHEIAYLEASRARDRLLAILSHELRAPLAPALFGLVELQTDDRFTEALPVLGMIRRNLEMLGRLIEELGSFTAVGEHKLRLLLEPLDAHEVIDSVMKICRSDIAAAQVPVQLDLGARETLVLADSVRLQQVLWNLLKNALKFSAAGNLISITTANEAPGKVSIEISDHGRGIDPQLLPLIFDAFQQDDLARQPTPGSLGLGLFIAKGMTEAQGGTITASSEGRGKGATFRVTLNTTPAPPPAAASSPAATTLPLSPSTPIPLRTP